MDLFTASLLGIVQGVTEFLPISSSGHLVLAEELLGLSVAELKSFDVILHAGTLSALLVLFYQEWASILDLRSFTRWKKEGGVLLGMLVVATIPAVLAGAFLSDWFDSFSRGEVAVPFIGMAFLVTGLFIFLAERLQGASEKIGWKHVMLMGLAQAVALLPGVSRSGLTMIAGMSSGLSRSAATRFSFLMLAPVATAAVAYVTARVVVDDLPWPGLLPGVLGFATAAVTSFLFARWFLDFVKRWSFRVFAWYLVLLGGGLLAFTLV